MQKLINRLDSLTGWSGDLLSSLKVNTIPGFVAGINTFTTESSIYLNVPAGNNGKFVEKDLQFDFTDYEDIVISFMSQNKGKEKHRFVSDFSYKIEFASGEEYYINANSLMNDITFHVPHLNLIEKIKITVLHNDADILMISNMYAVKDELPVDIFQSLKEQFEYDILNEFGNGIFLGELTGTANDLSANIIGNIPFLDNNAKIKIVGTTTEFHHIDNFFGDEVTFTDLYDGKKLLNNHTDADVYLCFEVQYGSHNTEAVFPSIIIWGFESEPFDRGGNFDTVFDTFNLNGTVNMRTEGKLQLYSLLIDIEAKHNEIIQKLSTVVRKWISRDSLWINGRKYKIDNLGAPTFIEDTELNIIPKIQYKALLELREELWTRKIKPLLTQEPNINITIN